MSNRNQLLEFLQQRRTCRSYASEKVPDSVLYQLIDVANRAPSAYNLQPWHFILVRDQELRQLLCHIAMDQEQVLNAPEVLAIVVDPKSWKSPYQRILKESVASGLMSEVAAISRKKKVHELFSIDPFGVFGFVKKVIMPLKRIRTPLPKTITSAEEAKAYVNAQAMFAAAYFTVGAELLGLVSCPVDSFDEERAKALLAVPSGMSLPLLIAFGYPLESDKTQQSYRLPILEKLSLDLYPNLLAKAKKPKS